jgi:DNA-binding winged helix-turn-helix (wHTH) protein/TolB-like protein
VAKTPGKAQDHCFGPYRFDAAKRLLFRDGELVGLSPKSLDVLAVLLEDRGEVVEKTDLLRRAWPDTTVEEVGLARNISLLRKEVGDWIETVPKKGYRFTSQPLEVARPRLWWPWIAALIALVWGYWQFFLPSEYLPKGKVAVAVARIEVLDGPATEAEKLREVLVTELAKLDGVHVVSPTTTKRYEGLHVPGSWMARLLGLEVLVEGTVMGGGKTTLRLIDVHTGRVIVANERLEDFVTGVRKSLKTK